MAIDSSKYLISFKQLQENFRKKQIPNNILLLLNSKILADGIIREVYEKFTGNKTVSTNNYLSFNAEERNFESMLNECSSTGLFAEKKLIVLRNVKKLSKEAKTALVDYLNNSNAEVCLIMTDGSDDFSPEKIFLNDTKDNEKASVIKKIIERNVSVFAVSGMSEDEMNDWIEEKFEGYKINKETIKYFLQFTNSSPDEIITEIEKFKTYCLNSKEITAEDVRVCNGISKDFNEFDFIKAVLERNKDKAYKIYSHISLKREIEVYLIFLLNSAFMAVYKLFDPAVSKLPEWMFKRELKLWFEDQEKLLPDYKRYRDTIDMDKIISALGYIYETDKLLKTSGSGKETAMASLINNICMI